MATFIPPPIQFKRSITPGSQPSVASLQPGEIAINLKDRIIFTRDSDSVVQLGFNDDYDSDFAKLFHDYQSADSDLFVMAVLGLDSEVVERKRADSEILWLLERIRLQVDSDNIVNVNDYDSDLAVLHHSYQAADSDLRVIVDATLDSEIPKIYHDFLSSDSDLRAGLFLKELNDVDVKTFPPRHGQVLTYDSDSERWIPSFVQTLTEMRRDSFVAAAGQTDFLLNDKPNGEVLFIRNAITLVDSASFVDSDGITVKYVAANNGNQDMRTGDIVEATYVVSTTTSIPSFILDGGTA